MQEINLLSGSNSVYMQIASIIKRRILTDKHKCGEKIRPVRDLALEFGVNPNTMQRALSELEREDILVSERTAGRFVTADEALIQKKKNEVLKQIMINFIDEIREYGVDTDEVAKMLAAYADDRRNKTPSEKFITEE